MAKRKAPQAKAKKQVYKNFSDACTVLVHQSQGQVVEPVKFSWQPPELLPGIAPEGVTPPVLAMDNICYNTNYANYMYGDIQFTGFPGYQYLANLTTRPEYQAFATVNSMELTREWITINSTGVESSEIKDKIAIIEQKMLEIDLRSVIRLMAEHVDYYGRGQMFVDIEGQDMAKPLILSSKTIPRGSFHGVKAIEPIWTTPALYNAINPAARDFYKPWQWYMMGYAVHASRLLTVITRPLPDILKPAFNFSGISLSQLAEPYVNNWIRTRQSIANLINNFSILALGTNMAEILQGGNVGQALLSRATLFTQTRNNQGLMLLDKDMEELTQIAVPLSGLNELQSQSQEHMCTVSGIPAVKLLGISPSGFNASPDGEIRTFYDKKAAEQEAYWRHPIELVMKIIMLSEFGEIDPSIGFVFNPLWQMDKKQEAEIRYFNSQTAANYLDRGVFSPMDIREILARDPESGFNGVDISDMTDMENFDPEAGNEEAQQQTAEPYADGETEND